MSEAGYHSGVSERGASEALVLPIKDDFHVGDEGIDYGVGVITWEAWYGTQMDHLKDVSDQLDYDIFKLHALWKESPPLRG